MRLLVVTPPQFGHVRPALPLARALAAARHRVAWASGADALSRLADEPVEAIVCGPTSAQARERLHACWPDLDRLTPREHGPAMRHRLFGEVVVAAMAPALERCLDDWRPDAVLHDPLALAVRPACRARGVPSVEHAFGWPLPPLPPRDGSASALVRRPGAPECAPGLSIEIVPAALRGACAGPAREEIECRPVERRPPDTALLPDPVRDLAARTDAGPLVLVSFGTAFHGRSALRHVAEMLARMPVRSIVLGTDRAALGVPSSPRQLCLPWLDQSAILPFCRAAVTHGGAGTVLGALAHGCPLVVLPQGADHHRNAEAVVRAEAGCAFEEPLDRAQLRPALDRLLEGDGRPGAEAAARAIAAMPAPAAAAARLVEALGGGAARPR